LVVRSHDQPDLVEVVYFRYHALYVEVADSIDAALAFIESGEDYGEMSSVGVYVNGEPVIENGYSSRESPTPVQADRMRELYRDAARDA
jgi:hypothetical protein